MSTEATFQKGKLSMKDHSCSSDKTVSQMHKFGRSILVDIQCGKGLRVICCSLNFLFLCSAAAAKLLQSCPTLCDPTDGSPSGFPIPGILQARTLEWVAISFSNA